MSGSRYCVVAVSNATGEVAGTIYAVPVGYYPERMAVSPDQRTVFIAQEDTDLRCDRTIVSVAIGASEVTVIAEGSWPALSADGTKLAYLADAWERSGRPRPVAAQGPFCGYEAFVIRDLQTGSETVSGGPPG